jgi:hypothetical protein
MDFQGQFLNVTEINPRIQLLKDFLFNKDFIKNIIL